MSGNIEKAVKKRNEDRFPSLFVLPKIICTYPAKECEHKFPIIQRLRTYVIASLTIDKLSAIVIIDIHHIQITVTLLNYFLSIILEKWMAAIKYFDCPCEEIKLVPPSTNLISLTVGKLTFVFHDYWLDTGNVDIYILFFHW